MSKPVTYSVLIRNGQKRCFEDLWARLYRELLWGPDAYEKWLNQGSEIDGEPEELSGVAIVDFDTKQLRWGEDGDIHEPPRAQAVHQRLLEQAWPGFTITFLSVDELYVEVQGSAERDEVDSEYVDRPNTVRDATLCLDEDDDIEEDYDDEEIDYPKAWLTIIDKDGKPKQRVLIEVSVDLIAGRESAIKRLLKLDAVAIPPEIAVKEGLWINRRDKKVGFWGGNEARRDFAMLKRSWSEWSVVWSDNGYADQCAISDRPGIPLSDAHVLAKFVPRILCAQKINMATVFGSVGGELRKTAMKATGCLVFVLALPILLAGFFMDKLKEASYATWALVAITAVVFKVIEYRVTSKFKQGPLNTPIEVPDKKPPVAGPLDQDERRAGLDRILRACGFPSLAELEPYLPDGPSLHNLL
ncbi:MAG TPA: hypothetical protein PLY87_31390 [Planctomycetaceae bacterium]|nr:hypothetical protein [Planctomycetaceae bacterium]HQZ69646.1 hypothetical protein [Planctomycetaceae bacterium]